MTTSVISLLYGQSEGVPVSECIVLLHGEELVPVAILLYASVIALCVWMVRLIRRRIGKKPKPPSNDHPAGKWS